MWPHMNHLLSRWCRNSWLLLGLIMAADYLCVTVTKLNKISIDKKMLDETEFCGQLAL